MAISTCPSCGTTQNTPEGVAGFRCTHCQTDVWRLICRKCKSVTALHGAISGSGAIEFRCGKCRARNQFAKQQLRGISAEVRRAQRAESTDRRRSATDQKHARAVYLLGRQEEVDELNVELQARFAELKSILSTSLDSDDHGSFDELRLPLETSHFRPRAELTRSAQPPDRSAFQVPALTRIQGLAPGARARHEAEVQKAEQSYEYAMRDYQEKEAARNQDLAREREAFRAREEQKHLSVKTHNAQIDLLEENFKRGDPDAVDEYMSGVLDGEFYPDAFPVGHRVAYSPNSKQLVIELELPSIEAIPEEREHKFVKTKDSVSSVPLPARERKAIHESSLAQLTIRTLWSLFSADPHHVVETTVLNGHIRSIDKRTGADIFPCVVTVRATRDHVEELDLRRIDPISCLQGLSASVSRSPSELVPVRPLLEIQHVGSPLRARDRCPIYSRHETQPDGFVTR